MRPNVQKAEYRNFQGLDKRTDVYQVPALFQTEARNLELQKGVYKCRPGYAQWGTLDHSSISGKLFRVRGFDIGAVEYVLFHKGDGIYWGLKTGTTPTRLKDRAGVDITVSAEESDFELMGKALGTPDDSGKTYNIKILFKQEDGCQIIEWAGTTWYGRDPGLDVSTADFTATAEGGGDADAGLYRCRLVALRIENGVRTIQSLHTGGAANAKPYKEVTLEEDDRIAFQVTHSGASSLITHYMLQVTRVLDMVGDTDTSKNNNDPTLFFETDPIAAATAIAGTEVYVAEDNLNSTCFNLEGYDTIPGHLISVISGGVVFFAGISPYPNRIYRAGDSGWYYHNEYYDTFIYHTAGEEDGQDVIGLGVCQDHLVILKEGSTGIIANREKGTPIVWRDKKLGALKLAAFDNLSEDQMIVLNQDSMFRIFNGIQYDRQSEVEGEQRFFSENIREISEDIDPEELAYIFHKEKLHIMYGGYGEREAVILHPRDNMGWTKWDGLYHRNNFLMSNGQEWVFEKGGKLFEQSAATPVYTDDGADIQWEVHFAAFFNPGARKDKVLIKAVGIEGEFNSKIFSRFIVDGGRVDTDWNECFPDPSTGDENVLFRQAGHGGRPLVGNAIELYFRGKGQCTIRGIFWMFIPKKSGAIGWSYQAVPTDYIEFHQDRIDAQDEDRQYPTVLGTAYNAGDETRDLVADEYTTIERG